MAYFRPHPDTSKRWVFNWLHWFVGNSAYVLAICSIFLAVELPQAELKGKLVDVMLIIYIAVHVIVHLILTFQHCKVSFIFLVLVQSYGGRQPLSLNVILTLIIRLLLIVHQAKRRE